MVNREVVIPRLKDELAKQPADLNGNVIEELQPQYDDATDVLIGGRCAVVDEKLIETARFRRAARQAVAVQYGKQWPAAAAYYMPAKDGRPTGYLLMDVTEPKNLAQRPSLALDGRPVLMTPHDYPHWLKPTRPSWSAPSRSTN